MSYLVLTKGTCLGHYSTSGSSSVPSCDYTVQALASVQLYEFGEYKAAFHECVWKLWK